MNEEHDDTIKLEHFQVYEYEVFASCVIEARFMVLGRTPEEARERWKAGHYENYFMPLGVEEWKYIDHWTEDLPSQPVPQEEAETLEFVDFKDVLESIAELEEA